MGRKRERCFRSWAAAPNVQGGTLNGTFGEHAVPAIKFSAFASEFINRDATVTLGLWVLKLHPDQNSTADGLKKQAHGPLVGFG